MTHDAHSQHQNLKVCRLPLKGSTTCQSKTLFRMHLIAFQKVRKRQLDQSSAKTLVEGDDHLLHLLSHLRMPVGGDSPEQVKRVTAPRVHVDVHLLGVLLIHLKVKQHQNALPLELQSRLAMKLALSDLPPFDLVAVKELRLLRHSFFSTERASPIARYEPAMPKQLKKQAHNKAKKPL